MKRTAIWMLAALSLAAAGIGQESSGDYRVGPKDLLEVRVLELPELNVERRVSDSGAIDLPLLGEMAVSGMTATEIRDRLETTVKAKYVNRANISIVVKEFANKPVSVLGAVQKPGSLSISGRWTLVNAITAAGGLTASAGHKIYVLRRAENGLSDTLEIRSDELFRSATALWNIPIQPSDIINIPARTAMTVFCLGEVKTPGALQFDSDDRLTLLSVIAKAGGLDGSGLQDRSHQAAGRGREGRREGRRLQAHRIGTRSRTSRSSPTTSSS